MPFEAEIAAAVRASDTVRLVKVGLSATPRVRASGLCWMVRRFPLTSSLRMLPLALSLSRKPPAGVSPR